MWLTVASSLRAFTYTVQGSGMLNLRTKFEQSANVLKNPAFATGLFRLSGIFDSKRLKSACPHDTYNLPKQLLPWIQMSRFSGDDPYKASMSCASKEFRNVLIELSFFN